MQVIGLDGCKHGAWVAARPGPVFEIVTDLRPFLAEATRGTVRLVLDVPVGLIGAGRACDAEARTLLQARRSSVFTPPSRPALAAQNRIEASDLNFAACGKRIGCQSFGILSRIRDVDRLMTPELQEHVHEGHPEVSFAVIHRAPMRCPKKVAAGESERLRVLAASGLHFDPAAVRSRLGTDVERDDVIDAAVMLATAMRIERGIAERLPRDRQQRDERGLLAEMWA